MSDKLKKLTGKNPKDFEPVAFSVINNPDIELFSELVSKEDFLFDFVKQNVASRLEKVCNHSNYLNLIGFLKYYSPSYEEFITSTLARFADEDLTDNMLDIFENGTEDEKTYCAKFFSYIQDPLAIDLLKKHAYSENPALSANCAYTLAILGETSSYCTAVEKLNSDDDFEKLDAVKFLVSYGDKKVSDRIIGVMKTSSMAENIAGELPYLEDIFSILERNQTDGLFVLNCIINGLGEILSLSQIFDFQLFDIFEYLTNAQINSQIATVLLNAKDKFETLTENDEYLFDESKDVKNEVNDIKNLLNSNTANSLQQLADNEIKEQSLFAFTALDLTQNTEAVRKLLSSSNQTLILKALEVLKQMDALTSEDKSNALKAISNDNIKTIILAM